MRLLQHGVGVVFLTASECGTPVKRVNPDEKYSRCDLSKGCSTDPFHGSGNYRIWLRNSLVRGSLAFLKNVAGGPCSTMTPRSVK